MPIATAARRRIRDRWTELNALLQIAVGYIAFELVGMLLLLPIVGVLYWMLKKMFFFLIDVVPTRGANLAEAQAGVVNGRGVWLGLKSDRDIETGRMMTCLNLVR